MDVVLRDALAETVLVVRNERVAKKDVADQVNLALLMEHELVHVVQDLELVAEYVKLVSSYSGY